MNVLDDVLARMWSDTLCVPDPVRADDDFLDLGGHSLTAMRLVGRLRDELGVRVDADLLFTSPTFGELTAEVGRALTTAGYQGGQRRSTSLIQKNRLLHDWRGDLRLRQQPVTVAWRGKGRIDRSILQDALDDVVAGDPVLRSIFPPDPSGDVTMVLPRMHWPLEDRGMVTEDEVPAILGAAWQRPFAFHTGPLLRAAVASVAEDDLLVIAMEHLLCDGISMSLLAGRLAQAYAARADHGVSRRPASDDRYYAQAERQRRELDEGAYEDEIAFWQRHWDDRSPHPRLLLPERGTPGDGHRGPARHVECPLPGIRARLGSAARAARGTPFMVALTAMALGQASYAPPGEVALMFPADGRWLAEQLDVVGFYANPLTAYFDIDTAKDFAGNLLQVRRTLLQVLGHQKLPTQEVVRRARPDADPLGLAHPYVFFDMRDINAAPPLRLAGMTARQVDTQPYDAVRWYPGLNVTLAMDGADGVLRVQYTEGRYDPADVDQYAGTITKLLTGSTTMGGGRTC
jgi:acyl carrier protein